MSLPFFYKEDIYPSSTQITLDEHTSKHMVQVLRMKNGEHLQLTDGKGSLFTCEIIDDNRKRCIVNQIQHLPAGRQGSKIQNSKFKITIAISLLKNTTRFEWFLEKATEIGITQIIPLICERTEKAAFKFERLNSILISAMLQSQQCWLPVLQAPQSFDNFVNQKFTDTTKFIAHCENEEKKQPLTSKLLNSSTSKLILIGPEGDFTPKEIELALQNNFEPVGLGNTRLRTETAGVVAAALLASKQYFIYLSLMTSKKLFSIFTFLLLAKFSVAQYAVLIDSAKKSSINSNSEAENIKTFFFIADTYMEIEQYDSAQIWLNKIHAILPVKANSLNNYFLITRQAEVYYYNNLQQLGLQESRRGLAMAQALNDSLLLADSYNFLGLFYMNIDSVEQSIPYYKKGLLYTQQPPFPSTYLSLSKPHHLYGNLAEAYYKLKNYESALACNLKSLEKATEISWKRGISVAYSGLGDVYLQLQNIDSAKNNYIKGINTALSSKDIDVALVCYGGLAKCHQLVQNNSNVSQTLAYGFDLLKQNPNINRFYALNFLNTAIDIYRKQNNNAELVKTLELKSSIETANIKGSNTQIQTILNSGVANEKRLLNMEVEDAKQKQKLANTRLLMVLAAMALLVGLFLLYRYYLNQKIAVAKMRQKISQDLHDDIGASLSSLQIYGAIAEKTIESNPSKAMDMVKKISAQSKSVMETMNDIVWSMRKNDTATTSLETKVKNFGAELLSEKNIHFKYSITPETENALVNITARKNILLIIKEAMNNMAKYSMATEASLLMEIMNKHLVLIIFDNGIGFDTQKNTNGNGLQNIKQRAKELNGTCTIESGKNNGTRIKITVPLKWL
ncbi:MAG: RsmE family RNA methyltransferase [Chitinophagaceae bacterium]|nr:RsmE family RNA methyltransferase [Chitinophagaceae bacterium]